MPRDPRLKHLKRSVETLNLSSHALRCLKSGNIRTIRELAASNEARLMKLDGCGPKTIADIRDALAQVDLTTSTVFDERGQIKSPAHDLIEKTRKLRQLTEKR